MPMMTVVVDLHWPRKGARQRIGVDLFHVKMPHLFRALAATFSKVEAFQFVQMPPQVRCQNGGASNHS